MQEGGGGFEELSASLLVNQERLPGMVHGTVVRFALLSSGCLGGGPDAVETRLGAGIVQMSPGRAADTDPSDDLAGHFDGQAAAEDQHPLIHIP